MDQIGNYVLYIIMACAVAGAFAAIYDSEKGLGKEFMEGIHATGYISPRPASWPPSRISR